MITFLEVQNLFYRWVTYVMNGIMMFLLIERDLERKDGKHLVNISLNPFDAPFFPCPYLRRDVIINGNVRVGMNILGNIEIESRIIYQNNDIRLPCNNIFFARRHVAQNDRQMEQYRDKAHISEFTIMLHTCASHF